MGWIVFGVCDSPRETKAKTRSPSLELTIKSHPIKVSISLVSLLSAIYHVFSVIVGAMVAASDGPDAAMALKRNAAIAQQIGRRVSQLSPAQLKQIADLQARHRVAVADLIKLEDMSKAAFPAVLSERLALLQAKEAQQSQASKDLSTLTKKETEEKQEERTIALSKYTEMVADVWKRRLDAEAQFFVEFLNILTEEQRNELLSNASSSSDKSSISRIVSNWSKDEKKSLSVADVAALSSAFSQGWFSDLFTSNTRPHG